MNNQEAFDLAVKHLYFQGERSYDYNKQFCTYRNSNGTRCAVGALIPDELYSKEMETKDIGQLINNNVSIKKYFEDVEKYLLVDLQDIHDSQHNWNSEGLNDIGVFLLRNLANRYGLNEKKLKKYFGKG